MFVQKTEWGQVSWLHTSDKNDLRQSLDVGITTVLAGKRIRPHIHYGHEQSLYILAGHGYYYINGEKVEYKKGMHFYIPADSRHETIPTGDEATHELMVSNPVFNHIDFHFENGKNQINQINVLFAAVEAIREQLLEVSAVPFTIFDSAWNVVSQGGMLPEYCELKCSSYNERKNCPCMEQLELSGIEYTKSMHFTCPNGLNIIQIQIVFENYSLGVIRGGHFLATEPEVEMDSDLFVTPQATIAGIQKMLMQIVNSILKFCEFNKSRKLLLQKDELIRISETDKQQLAKNLCIAQENVTNLKINHHFLFNTLNSMASMALTGSNDNLYNAIIDLSKMFRYTMATNLQFIPFNFELEYLNTYLNLQRLRYGNCLRVKYDISKYLNDIQVPFNFMQPIVENAFTHGFVDEPEYKKIEICAKPIDDYINITIRNNGSQLNDITLNRVKRSLENNSGHGLSLVYAKLKSAYGENFMIDITSHEHLTAVIVNIPLLALN